MTAAAIVVGLIIFGLVLGTYLLQAAILLIALVIQIAGWVLTGLIGGGYMIWLALTDRPELGRLWRRSRSKRSPSAQVFG